MLDLINTPPHKIVFLGPGCSIATKPIAEAASYWQAVQVSVRNKSNKIISKKKNEKQEANKTNNKNNETSELYKKENNNNKKIKTRQKRSPFVFFAFY